MAGLYSDLAESAPAIAAINTAWLNATGVSASADGLNYWEWAFANGGTLANLVSDLGYSAQAAAAINTAWINATGIGAPSDVTSYWQWAFANGNNLSGLMSDLAYSAAAAIAVNTLYQNELGRPTDPSGLSNYTAALADGGQTLQGEMTAVAYSPEATEDISGAFQSVIGVPIDATTQSNYQMMLGNGGTDTQVVQAMLMDPGVTAALSNTIGQLEGASYTDADVAVVQSAIEQSIGNAPITWNTIVSNLLSELGNFLSYLSPISSASAATLDSPTQIANNQQMDTQYLQIATVQAWLATIQWAEGGDFNLTNRSQNSAPIADKTQLPPPAIGRNQSSASGAYQILAGSHRAYAQHVGVTDEQNSSQQLVATQMLVETGVMAPLLSGNLHGAALATGGPTGKNWSSFSPNGIEVPSRIGGEQGVIAYYNSQLQAFQSLGYK